METIKLYNESTWQGKIVSLKPISKTGSGDDYIVGLIQTYTENQEGKRYAYASTEFIAWKDQAKQLSRCKEGDVVLVSGYFKNSQYTNKEGKQVNKSQLTITTFNYIGRSEDAPIQSAPKPPYQKPQPKEEEEKPFILDDDSLPF